MTVILEDARNQHLDDTSLSPFLSLSKAQLHDRAFLKVVIEQTPSGLIIVDYPSGKILLSNEEAIRILGHQQIDNDDYTEYEAYHGIHEDGTPYRAEEYPTARALLYGEYIKHEHMRYQHPEGIIHLSVNAAPVRDEQGNQIAVVCTFHDISAQYELEQRKDDFIGMITHELRTPLTTIKGNMQLAQRRVQRLLRQQQEQSGELVEDLSQLETLINRSLRQAEIQKRLISDLLDASRAFSHHLTIECEPENLVVLVKSTVEDAHSIFSEREIILDIALPDPPLVVNIDRGRIGQVITNYLSNAHKYSPLEQPVTVGLTVENGQALVWVQDHGQGIQAKEIPHIWERFYRIKMPDEKKNVGGANMGLGLYICRQLVELHQGSVGVASTPGHGSRFWFTLPISQEKPD